MWAGAEQGPGMETGPGQTTHGTWAETEQARPDHTQNLGRDGTSWARRSRDVTGQARWRQKIVGTPFDQTLSPSHIDQTHVLHNMKYSEACHLKTIIDWAIANSERKVLEGSIITAGRKRLIAAHVRLPFSDLE